MNARQNLFTKKKKPGLIRIKIGHSAFNVLLAVVFTSKNLVGKVNGFFFTFPWVSEIIFVLFAC